jgi:hypothetical protein
MDTNNENNNKTELKKEDRKALFLSVFMIIFLIGITFWRTRNNDIVKVSFPEMSDEIDIPSVEELTSQEYLDNLLKDFVEKEDKNEWKEKIIEEKIKISYPSSWNDLNIYEENNNEKIETLFFSNSLSLSSPVVFIVLKASVNNIDEAIDIIKTPSSDNVLSIELLEEKTIENECFFKTLLTQKDGKKSISLIKIFPINSLYYIAFTTIEEKNYNNSSKLMEKIISSVQIIK